MVTGVKLVTNSVFPMSFLTEDVTQWLRRYELCSKANGCNESAQLLRLPKLLAGRAFSVYERLELTEDQRKPIVWGDEERVFEDHGAGHGRTSPLCSSCTKTPPPSTHRLAH